MNRLSSLFLTIAALLAAPAADAQHVDVTPRRIEVGFNKTVHILFPSPVTYIDIGSMDIIAGKAAGAENVVRVKAAVRDFPKETNLTVITEDGGYYSFDARYAENPQVATHEIGAATSASPAVQTPPAEGRVLLEATGRERPAVVKKTLNDIYRLNRTEMRLRKKHYGIETEVQGIYVRNDVIYIHLSLYNNSNISFEVEDLHFRIEDRKVAKRTAQQITHSNCCAYATTCVSYVPINAREPSSRCPSSPCPTTSASYSKSSNETEHAISVSRFATSRSGWHGPFDPQRIAPSGTIISAGELLYY